MNHDKESYFWNARKIVNTDEAANEPFVRLVAGLGTTADEFFGRRRGAGEVYEATLNRHVYADEPARLAAPVTVDPRFVQLQAEHRKRDAVPGEARGMIRGQYPRAPVRANGLIASDDGLSWREPALTSAEGSRPPGMVADRRPL